MDIGFHEFSMERKGGIEAVWKHTWALHKLYPCTVSWPKIALGLYISCIHSAFITNGVQWDMVVLEF